jgi:competence protein ComEC
VVWALAVPQPDILISGDGHNVGVRGQDGRLHLMRTGKDAFLSRNGWRPTPTTAPRAASPADASLAMACPATRRAAWRRWPAAVRRAGAAAAAEALADDCERNERRCT